MDLPSDQGGVLVQQVEQGSPADRAGLRGSYKPVIIEGKLILVGGDTIVGLDGEPVDDMDDLVNLVQGAQPDQEVTLAILRDGSRTTVEVRLGERPALKP
jgi:S1-C subfamily serine protease